MQRALTRRSVLFFMPKSNPKTDIRAVYRNTQKTKYSIKLVPFMRYEVHAYMRYKFFQPSFDR